MISSIAQFFSKAVKSPDIRKKIIISALIVLVYRLVAHIPASGIDRASLQALFLGSPLLSLLDIFSGGTLANFSIMALGIQPYITASIVIQMISQVVPKLEELYKEGEMGQEKINQYTRILTIPLSFFQAFAIYALLKNQGIITSLNPLQVSALIATMTAGSMFAVWLGELITEYGFTNGISLLVFIGIVSRLPVTLGQSVSVFSSDDIFKMATFAVIAVFIISAVVFINESVRQIPVNHARRSAGTLTASSYLPLRLNQAGVMPIIFAVSLVLMPSLIGQYLSGAANPKIAEIALKISQAFDPRSVLYNVFYFLLVFGFTYFYTTIVFNPQKIADDFQKRGSFIPGIRPGKQTEDYLNKIVNRITVVGGAFLGLVAIMPSFFQNTLGVTYLTIGGTGILIVVSVALDLTREIESQLVMKKYDVFIK